ncbi:MAG TPA: CBS domain-containing protein [Rhodocyclaceae bacterium]|nr:CBS domain-containing protein [Rhodocyclaceae bacterium]
MAIGEFCNRQVVVAPSDTTVLKAAQLMRHHHVGCLVVIAVNSSPKCPAGIVTDRDLVMEVLAKEVAPDSITLGDLLVGKLHSVRSDVGVFDTLRYMRDLGVRRMPVVDADGELTGIVTLDDCVSLLAEELAALARLINCEQRHEERQRSG